MFKKSCLRGILVFVLIPFLGLGQGKIGWQIQPMLIQTRWAKDVKPENPLPEYPRPQMVRKNWQNLNGLWDYAITAKDAAMPSTYQGKILVPYPLESALSGVKKALKPSENLWYKRVFTKPVLKGGEHILLHFGAVDWQASVYMNGKEICTHTGGYQTFTQDITVALKEGENEIVVKVYDPTNQGIGPHGKQMLNPESIYYTPSSGIWQTVWLEIVPAAYITGLGMTPDIDKNILKVNVNAHKGTTVELIATVAGKVIGKVKGKVGDLLSLPVENAKLWSPENPFLYDLTVKLTKGAKTLDEVKSYFGMRKIAIQKDEKGVDRIFLNNKPYFNLGTLDQGFWPDGLYTAPTDNALKFDIQAIKAMGFNTIRKHIKVESARWYYYADKFGVLVWQDFVNPNQGLPEGAKEQYEKETRETLEQLHNTPSITTWVIFNEKWGQYDQRRITEWIKASDPSRLVDGHSGELLYVNDQLRSPSPDAWVSADMTDVHSYPMPRNAPAEPGKARVLGEFGGIGVPILGHLWDDLATGWGYDGVVTPTGLRKQYKQMIDSLIILKKEGLSACIYTQPFDVESEQNGFLTYDRSIIKIPIDTINAINSKLSVSNYDSHLFDQELEVKIADTTGNTYDTELLKYSRGKKDSAFLRGLTVMAGNHGDTINLDRITRDYLNIVKDTFSVFNAKYILKFAYTTQSPCFNILLNNQKRFAETVTSETASYMAQAIIYNEKVKPTLSNTPSQHSIDSIIKMYPQIDGEYIIGLSVVHYFSALLSQNRRNAGKNSVKNAIYMASIYDNRFNTGDYNTWAWLIFETSQDTVELKKALEWSKKSLERTDESSALYGMALDTYANILYKLGRIDDAIAAQEKAILVRPNDSSVVEALEKMRQGKPTWPVQVEVQSR